MLPLPRQIPRLQLVASVQRWDLHDVEQLQPLFFSVLWIDEVDKFKITQVVPMLALMQAVELQMSRIAPCLADWYLAEGIAGCFVCACSRTSRVAADLDTSCNLQACDSIRHSNRAEGH